MGNAGKINLPVALTNTSAGYIRDAAETMASVCDSIELPVTASNARRFLAAFQALGESPWAPGTYESRAAQDAVSELLRTFREESRNRVALVIPANKAALYLQKDPLFGEAVSLKFAKVAADISEAGKCLALERPTACVFHLMRVVEYAVQRLGKKLHVAIDVEKETWYQITIHIDKALNALPAQTTTDRRNKQKIAAATAHLNSVRIATRNDVMHPKATYTDEEAQTLFDATKALMQQMAKIV